MMYIETSFIRSTRRSGPKNVKVLTINMLLQSDCKQAAASTRQHLGEVFRQPI